MGAETSALVAAIKAEASTSAMAARINMDCAVGCLRDEVVSDHGREITIAADAHAGKPFVEVLVGAKLAKIAARQEEVYADMTRRLEHDVVQRLAAVSKTQAAVDQKLSGFLSRLANLK